MKGNKIKPSLTLNENFVYAIVVAVVIILYLIIRFIKKSALASKNNQIIKKQDAKITTIILENKNENPIHPKSLVQAPSHKQQSQNINITVANKIKKQIATQTDEVKNQNAVNKSGECQILRQELQIERNRNIILEQKMFKINKQQIKNQYRERHRMSMMQDEKLQSQQLIILKQQLQKIRNEQNEIKNELQFVQKKLQQSSRTQEELRRRIQSYQNYNTDLLNHPQYIRLRELNNTYKTMLSTLQKYLFYSKKNSNKIIDLSFCKDSQVEFQNQND